MKPKINGRRSKSDEMEHLRDHEPLRVKLKEEELEEKRALIFFNFPFMWSRMKYRLGETVKIMKKLSLP